MRTTLFLLMILITSTLQAQKTYKVGNIREKPRILIKYLRPSDEKMEGSEELYNLRNNFEGSVAEKISQEFPCAQIHTFTEVQAWCAQERIWNIMKDGYSSLKDIGDMLECDILITLSSYELGGKFYFGASALDPNSANVRSKNVSTGKDSQIDYSELINQLIRDLVEMELCPYKGEVTFTSVKTYKDYQERTGLPDQDCEFKASKSEDNKTEETWNFRKEKRYEGTAKVNYTIKDSKKETEHNTCLHCQKMDNGVKIDQFEAGHANMNSSFVITETYSATQTASLGGLRLMGMNALVKITFNTLANNYTITVGAVSEPAKWTKKTAIRNSGCPYDENSDKEIGATYAVKCDRSFGPFPGSPYQKSLKQTITKTMIAEDGKGQTIEKISFNLTR